MSDTFHGSCFDRDKFIIRRGKDDEIKGHTPHKRQEGVKRVHKDKKKILKGNKISPPFIKEFSQL